MFSAKGFAGGKDAAQSFGSVVAVIVGSDIAATIAAAKPAGSSVERPTVVTGRLRKEGWINGTARESIDKG